MSGQSLCSSVKSSVSLPAVAMRAMKLARIHGLLKGCCPVHGERTPSFVVYEDHFHCFGCGIHGDIIDFIKITHNCDTREALRVLGCDEIKSAPAVEMPPPKDRATEEVKAQIIWRDSFCITGRDAAAKYLELRGIGQFSKSRALRSRRDLYHPSRSAFPGMVARIQDAQERTIGVQRFYLTPDGHKASCDPQKAIKGSLLGGAVRLHPMARHIVIAEGIETAASASRLFRLPAWAAVTSGNLALSLTLPDAVRIVTIAADNDRTDGNGINPGIDAAWQAAKRFQTEGREVRIFAPNQEKQDFNDLQLAGSSDYSETKYNV